MLTICGIRTAKRKTNRMLNKSTEFTYKTIIWREHHASHINTNSHIFYIHSIIRIWVSRIRVLSVWDLIILAFRFYFTSAQAHNSVFFWSKPCLIRSKGLSHALCPIFYVLFFIATQHNTTQDNTNSHQQKNVLRTKMIWNGVIQK